MWRCRGWRPPQTRNLQPRVSVHLLHSCLQSLGLLHLLQFLQKQTVTASSLRVCWNTQVYFRKI